MRARGSEHPHGARACSSTGPRPVPMAMAYRTFSLRAPQRVTWRQVYRQFGLHPAKASENQTVQNFRYKVLRELKKIKLALAGPELFNGSWRADPLSLNTDHRSVRSRPANKLISPFPASRRHVRLDFLVCPTTQNRPGASKSLVSTACVILDSFSTCKVETPTPTNTCKVETPTGNKDK